MNLKNNLLKFIRVKKINPVFVQIMVVRKVSIFESKNIALCCVIQEGKVNTNYSLKISTFI
jgi:hypothetical protein